MEPERKIEKLLRAYAKKRKADAGDSFSLSSATRRRLQAEVDKQFAEPPEEESVSLWQLFRQQWAVLTAFALVIFFVAAAFLPALSKAKMKAQNVSAMSSLKPTGAAAQMAAVDNSVRLPATLDELTNSHPISAALAEVASTRRAAAERSDTLAFDQPAPAAAPVAAGGTVALNGIYNFGGGGGGGNNSTTENKDRLLATAAPAASAKQLFKDAERDKSETLGVNGNSNSQKFRNAVANAAPVLVSFELQQNGNSVAVVDADGSVYQGSLQTNSPVAQSQTPVVAPPGAAQNAALDVAKNQSAAGNNFYFRVAGQNRTSKQNVVFTGNLIPMADNAANLQAATAANNAGGVAGIAQAQNANNFANSRIAGTVTVDSTNQIEINALPTAP